MKRIDMIIDAIDEGVSFDYEVRKTAKGRTKVVLKNVLDCLGIEAPEEM